MMVARSVGQGKNLLNSSFKSQMGKGLNDLLLCCNKVAGFSREGVLGFGEVPLISFCE